MDTNQRRYTGIVWVVLLGLTLLWCFLVLRPRPQLLDRANLLLPAGDWRRDYTGYFWKSDHEILYVKDGLPSRPQLYRADTQTGAQEALTQLNDSWKQPLDTQTWRLSPDGKWLLARGLAPTGPVYTAYALDGSRQVVWPAGRRDEMSILWMPDSRRWVGFEPILPAVKGGVAMPRSPFGRRAFDFDRMPIGVQTVLHSLDGPDKKGARINGPFSWPLGTTPEGGVRTGEQGTSRIDFYEYGLDPKAAFTRHFSVPLAGTSVLEVEPSPNGDRLALLSASKTSGAPLQFLFEPFFPSLRRNKTRYALWVCRADGSGLREIGSERGNTLAGVQWSPNGKRLSFFGRRALYTVSAD